MEIELGRRKQKEEPQNNECKEKVQGLMDVFMAAACQADRGNSVSQEKERVKVFLVCRGRVSRSRP